MFKKRSRHKFKAVNLVLLIISTSFYLSLLAEPTIAVDVCCQQTIHGDTCLYTDESQCDQTIRQLNSVTACEQTSYCQVGCCYGLEQGCSRNVGKATCEAAGGTFSPDASCNAIEQCKQVCCTIGNQCSLTTFESCQNLGESLGAVPTIRDVGSEAECLSYCQLDAEGCCTTPGTCTYGQQSECLSINGDFHSGQYCSTVSECGVCQPQNFKGCLDGEDDVFWFDSCGNREGVAEECDFISGTACGEVEGEITCKSLDCPNTEAGFKKNGESWCITEGSSELGLQSVGSRYYRSSCFNGEEIIEPCRDFRAEVCVEGVKKISGKDYSEAACVKNNWQTCINQCNTGNPAKDRECCESPKNDCRWVSDTCVPLVPAGSRFWEKENENICSIADTSITVYWQKKHALDDWDCEANCQFIEEALWGAVLVPLVGGSPGITGIPRSEDKRTYSYPKGDRFVTNYNAYCSTFGDCGANYNYLGNFSDDGYRCISSGGSCRGKTKGDIYDISKIKESFLGGFDETGNKVKIFLGELGIGIGGIDSDPINFEKIGEFFAYTAIGWTIVASLVQGSLVFPPFTWVLAVAAVFFFLLALTGDTHDETFNLKCEPWQAPPGGNTCSLCDEDPLLPCTEYKCRSLGLNCEYIPENEGTSRPTCFNAIPNDFNSPVISPIETQYQGTEEINGFKITDDIPAHQRLNFGVKTNEPAQCKYSDSPGIAFDDMNVYFGDSFYVLYHNITINPFSNFDYNYYIRCEDKSGNVNQRDYLYSFSTVSGTDFTPPLIEEYNPENNGFVAKGVTNITVDIFLNEPAKCRWSSLDKSYQSMTGIYNCLNNQEPDKQLFRCQTFLPFSEPSKNYFIRCQDHANNTNVESYRYTLKGSEPLEITSAKPEGKVVTETQTIEISTISGSQQGISICKFAPSDVPFKNMIEFLNTNSNTHSQQLRLDPGTYIYYVKCQDTAGNEASETLSFSVDVDRNPPRINRMFRDGNNFNLILDEPAVCEYSSSKFEFGSGINMPDDNSISHTAPLMSSYIIECIDQSDNSFGQIRIFP